MNLPQYQCHKIVNAGLIKEIIPEPNGNGGAIIKFRPTHPDDALEDIIVTQSFLDKHKPVIDGYYVVYEDGYESYSPAAAFESGYTRI